MKTNEIRLLYEYNDWVEARFLAACTRVSPEQYAASNPFGTGYGGLRATMVHLLDNLWQTRRPMTRPSFTKTPFRHSTRCESAG